MLALILVGTALGVAATLVRVYMGLDPELRRRERVFYEVFDEIKRAKGLQGSYQITLVKWPTGRTGYLFSPLWDSTPPPVGTTSKTGTACITASRTPSKTKLSKELVQFV